jgi:hypothetical protein
MSKVRILIGVILVAFAAWSAWWWIGAQAHREALASWLDQRRADGWVAESGELSVVGYPNRFDAVLENLHLADPEAGWAWTAPEFRTYMLSYEPNRVIVVWPGAQTIAAPGEKVEVTSENMRASLALVPGTSLALERAVAELKGVRLASELGWSASLADGQLSVRRSEEQRGRDNAYDAVLDGTGLRPPEALRDLLGGGGGLPETIDRLRLDLTAAFGAPLDRHAVEGPHPPLQAVWLRPSEFIWGEVTLEAEGRIDLDAEGVPKGRFDLRAQNWRAMLDAAVAAGAIDPSMAGTLRSGLELIAMFSGDGESLEAPLRFESGMMFLGPVPLGAAPRLGG